MPTTSSPASRPDALEDFLATPPSWLLHSGMGLMCTIAIMAVAMSWFIRYPDRIQATALLRTQQAPVEVVCANGGRLDSILVVDQQWVSCGQALCLLQNTARWEDIQRIEKTLNLPLMSSLNTSIGSLELGNVQSSFANWDHARESLFQFLNQNLTQQQIAALQQEAEHNKQLDQALAQRREIYLQEVELVQREYDRACSLNTQKIISDQELEAKKMAWLQAHRAIYNLNEETIHNRMRAEQLLTEQLRLRVESQIGLEEVTHHFHQATQYLQVALAEWKQNYLVTAPIDGTLVWQTGLGQGQYLNSNKSPGTVIPGNTQTLIAICTAPVIGSGRMNKGNRVQIELEAFPPDEFGYLEGKVNHISRLPSADQEGKFFYQVEVKLPDTLRSSYGKIIPFRQNLSGTARIVTKERRMLERLIGKLWQMTDNI